MRAVARAMLDRIRWRLAAFRYAGRLPDTLHRNFGARRYYSEVQLRRAAQDCHLNPKYIALAFAKYLTDTDYDRLAATMPMQIDRQQARELFDTFIPQRFLIGMDNTKPTF